MDALFLSFIVSLFRKGYYFVRYRNKEERALKEFEQRGNISIFFLKGFAILFLLLIAMLLYVTIGRTIYDLIKGNHIY